MAKLPPLYRKEWALQYFFWSIQTKTFADFVQVSFYKILVNKAWKPKKENGNGHKNRYRRS